MGSYTENVLSLCSGVGQLDLGYRLAFPQSRTVCYVEIEAFVQQVLVARIEDKLLDDAPIWSDLKTFDGNPWCGVVDTIIGGFPCQPFSDAGKKRGVEDPRHLWPYIAKLIGVIRPSRCFFENVPGILSTRDADGEYAIEVVQRDLQEMGYGVEVGLFSAEEVGAPHKRVRVFILAELGNSDHIRFSPPKEPSIPRERKNGIEDRQNEPWTPKRSNNTNEELGESDSVISEWIIRERDSDGDSPSEARCTSDSVERVNAMAYANGGGLQGGKYREGLNSEGWEVENGQIGKRLDIFPPYPENESSWREISSEHPELTPATQPAVRRMANGLDAIMDTSLFAYRQDRLRAVGNGVVPLTVALAASVLSRRMSSHA